MDLYPVPVNGDTAFLTTDRMGSRVVTAPCDRAGIAVPITFMGAGVFTGVAPASGVAVMIRNVHVRVLNAGGPLAGGTLVVQYTRPKYPAMNIPADDAAGSYSGALLPTIVVDAGLSSFQAFDMLGNIPHVTMAYSGTNLVRVTSTLGVGDEAEVVLDVSPVAAALSCQ